MRALFTFLFLLIIQNSFSQVIYEIRKEINLDDKEFKNYMLYEFQEKGVVLYSQKSKTDIHRIEKLDIQLDIVDSLNFKIPDKQKIDEAFTNDSNLFLLFKSRKGDYSLVSIDVKNMKIKKYNGSFPKKTYVKSMNIIGNMAFFEIKVKNTNSVTTFNLTDERQGVIPIFIKGYKDKNIYVENVQIEENINEYFVFVNTFKKRIHNLHVLRYDKNAKLVDNKNLSEKLDAKLSSASVTAINKNEFIYAGTYSTVNSSSSEGLYFCKMINEQKKFMKFYNFMDFSEFLSYLPERRQNKIEKKKKRKEKRGKSFKLNYYIASHEVVKINNKYFFLGEAYYPTYRTETYTDSNGNTQTRQVFDGYQYTHATLVAFDENGLKLWDKTFEMFPSYKPFYPRKFISMTVIEEKINLLFMNRNDLVSSAYSIYGEVVNEKKYDFLETGNENDRLRYTNSDVFHWYDNFFISYGFQKIKNKTDETYKRKRKVFFINKISYK